MGKHSLWPIFDAKRFFKSNGIFANIFFLFFCFHSNHCGHVLVTNALKQLDINSPLTDTVVNKCLCIFYTETKKIVFFLSIYRGRKLNSCRAVLSLRLLIQR